jgi:hypothetical protein
MHGVSIRSVQGVARGFRASPTGRRPAVLVVPGTSGIASGHCGASPSARHIDVDVNGAGGGNDAYEFKSTARRPIPGSVAAEVFGAY